MRILIIAPTPFFSDRGCHIRIYEEVVALQKKGYAAEIFTYHLGKNPAGLNIHRIINIPWYKKTSAGASWHKLYLDALLFLKIISTKNKFDVIHAHLHEGCLIGWLVKILRFRKLKLIFDSQGSLVEEMESQGYLKQLWLKKMFMRMENFINSRADAIITSSNFLAGATVVPDGVNLDSYKKITISNHQEPLIIYTGGLTRDKGVLDLFMAMQQVPAKLLVIGYPVLEEFKTICPEKISFLGQVSYFDLPKYLAQADVAVDPKPLSSTEASGKIINYMTAGLKVVCHPSAHNQSLLGNLGFYIGDSLSDTLIKALNSSNAVQEQELNIIKKHFCWNDNINKIIELYAS